MNSELETQGYILLPGILNHIELKNAREGFLQDQIIYSKLTKVNQNYLEIIKYKLGLNLASLKYRASNNNNSTDAGMFHRDIHLTQLVSVPIYTCLLYLDDSEMEIVPKSHSSPVMSYVESVQFFLTRKRLKIPAGSILLFHSSLIHRGIFEKPQKNRRLIQQFTCIPLEKTNELVSKILHAPCPPQGRKNNARCNQILQKIPIVHSFCNFFVYLNVARGYAFRSELHLATQNPDIICISPETNQKRIEIKSNILYPSNKFVVHPDYKLVDLEMKDYQDFNFYSHWYHHILIGTKIIGLGICLIWMLTSFL